MSGKTPGHIFKFERRKRMKNVQLVTFDFGYFIGKDCTEDSGPFIFGINISEIIGVFLRRRDELAGADEYDPDFKPKIGTIFIRGLKADVIDFRLLLGTTKTITQNHSSHPVVIANVAGQTMGVVFSKMAEIISVSSDIIKPLVGPPRNDEKYGSLNTDFIKCVVDRSDGEQILVLDLEKVFAAVQ
jgi:hypothetical protein